METHQYNPEFQSNFDMFDNRDKQGFYVRKLSFDGNFSPMNQFNENLEDYDLEFIMTRDKRCQEPQAPNVCYRKLCFGADNEKDDPFSSGIQPRDFNRDQIFGSNNDFSSAKRSLKKMFTPKRADTVHDFDMQSENSSSRRRGNLQTPENNLFLGLSRNNSQDMALQLGTTAVPEEEEEFEMELELDTPACFESTPQKTLPTCKNYRNPGLSSITPQTLVDLMAQNVNYIIIDCRYDYEYEGGHIKGAIHIDSPEALETLFITHRQFLYNKTIVDGIKEDPSLLNTPSHLYNYLQTDKTEPCPPIVIFHCEFSQKRGPRGLRKLRDLDITINANNWPNVYYPEVYILDGGYRNFRTQFPGSCCPENSYVTMIDEAYKDRYYLARQQEKSTWGTSDDSKRKLGKMLGLQRAKTMFPY